MKSFLYHVSRDGRRIATWSDALSLPSFSAEVDGSISPLSIRLARPFGDDCADLALGNIVQTYAIDERGQTLIHEGTIEKITDRAGASGDAVSVSIEPYVTQLARDYFRDTSTTIAKSWSSTEVATIITYILDQASLYGGAFSRIRYGDGSIQTTGKTLSIQVGSETYLSAIKRIKKLGPGNFYWYVEPSGLFHLRSYDSGTRHHFTLGRDVTGVERTRDITELRNTVFFWNQSDADGTVIAFERPETESASQTSYGRRVEVVTDSRIDSEATAEAVTDAFIDEHENPVETYELTVQARGTDGIGYDIEDLRPGDTCDVANLPALSGTVLSILRVDYTPSVATLLCGFGPARRPRTLGMAMDEMATFMRTSTDGSIPSTFTA